MAAIDPEADVAFRNIWRMLEMHKLDDHIIQVGLKTADRFFFEAAGTMVFALEHRAARRQFVEMPPSGGPHKMVYRLYSGNWGRQRSWRSIERPSLQLTLTELRTSMKRWVGDADIDLGNPVMDVVGFLTHLVEVVIPGKTSHKKLEKAISRRYEEWQARQGRDT